MKRIPNLTTYSNFAKKLHKFISCIMLIACHTAVFAENNATDSLGHHLQRQRQLFPQEKIYLHTDRSSYAAGDTIWFRAHLVDAATHQANVTSRYVYVELIDPDSKMLKRIKLRPSNKIFQGHIAIDNMLPQGYYTLRAYTRFMENLTENYFFHSNIAITNPVGTKQTGDSPEKKEDAPKRHTPAFDVSFYPEGGYLPEGVLWRVAFKGVNQDGWSDQVYGHVLERSTGDTVATLQHSHRGMGVFMLKAEKGKEYVAKCINSQNRYAEFELPSPIEDVPILSAHWVRDRLGITLSAPQAEGVHLVMHTRGMVFYNQPWNPKQPTLLIHKEQMPAGVIQIVLTGKDNKVLSERLIFNQPSQSLQTTLNGNKEIYGKREAVEMETLLNLLETDSTEVGNFSVSVCHNEEATATPTASIYTYLLLTSELKGEIELPETYFEQNDRTARQNLDLLMLTQGWRRYNIQQVAKGEYKLPTTQPEIGQEIHGQAVSEFNSDPRPGAQILMIISGHRFYEEKKTDSLGRFCYTHLDFPDNTKFILRALNQKGKSHDVQLNIQEEEYPTIPAYTPIGKLLNRGEIKKELNINALNDSTLRLIELQDIEITASYKTPKTPIGFMPNATTSTFDEKYYEKKQVYDMYDLLNSTPYVTCFSDSIAVRALPNIGYGVGMSMVSRDSIPTLIMVDNLECTAEQVLSLDAEDVEEVTVVRKLTNSMFDMQGYGALLLIYTKPNSKRAKRFSKINIAGYTPLGYQHPAAFYSPKYESPSRRIDKSDRRTTLFWNPAIPIDQTGKAKFRFYTGDKEGIYTILVQGVTTDGEIIHAKKNIQVE